MTTQSFDLEALVKQSPGITITGQEGEQTLLALKGSDRIPYVETIDSQPRLFLVTGAQWRLFQQLSESDPAAWDAALKELCGPQISLDAMSMYYRLKVAFPDEITAAEFGVLVRAMVHIATRLEAASEVANAILNAAHRTASVAAFAVLKV